MVCDPGEGSSSTELSDVSLGSKFSTRCPRWPHRSGDKTRRIQPPHRSGAKTRRSHPPCPERLLVQRHLDSLSAAACSNEWPDSTSARQSAFFSQTVLARSGQLTSRRQLTNRELRELENSQALGGMRRPDLSVKRSDMYHKVGNKLRILLENPKNPRSCRE